MTLIVFLGKAKQQCYERQSLNCQFISTDAETFAYLVITLSLFSYNALILYAKDEC